MAIVPGDTMKIGITQRLFLAILLAAALGVFFDFFVAETLPPVADQIGTALLGILLTLAFARIGAAMLKEGVRQTAPRAAKAVSPAQ